MNAARFAAQRDPLKPLKFIAAVAEGGGLQLWERVFSIDFFEFRHHLQTISADNLAAVADATVRHGADTIDWQAPGDDLLYPIDDDDFFHPELVARTHIGPDQNVTMWPAVQRRAEDGRSTIGLMPARVLFTNNGGLRRRFLVDRLKRSDAQRVIADHRSATSAIRKLTGLAAPADDAAWYECSLEHPSVAFTLDRCSVSIKHPAALSTLHRALMSDAPEATLRAELAAEPVTYDDDLAWSQPWVERVEELLRGALR